MNPELVQQFEKIYEQESDSIFRFCLIRVSNRDQALDITQETFLRLWREISEKKQIGNNRAFLFTICRRLVIDWYRKKKSVSLDNMLQGSRDDEKEYDVIDPDTMASLDLNPEGRYLLDKINELSPTHREPVYLRFVERLTPAEIGEILGVSANAASVRINRGLVELKQKTGYDNKDSLNE